MNLFKSALILAIAGSAAILGSQFIPATKASDEEVWVEQARTECVEKKGTLITRADRETRRALGVLCVPLIFERDAP